MLATGKEPPHSTWLLLWRWENLFCPSTSLKPHKRRRLNPFLLG